MKRTINHIKKAGSLALLAAVALSFSSCAAGPNAKRGAVGGAAIGAVAGGIIGHQSGRGLEGAAIGAGAGAVGGGVLGSAHDDVNRQNPRY